MATLYVVATPIGNLQDLSPRAVDTMKEAGLIIAEDKRITMKLCQVFSFPAPIVSCHRHNEENKAVPLAEKILSEDLAAVLVTDAGTPCISDPGNEVVRECILRGIRVIPVPGCCAGIAALSISGFDAREFAFYGFLPREKQAQREKLREIAYAGIPVAVIYESPFRIIELTESISEILPDTRMTVCCDLTKLHEMTLYGKPEIVLTALKANDKTEKGEYCVILDLHGFRKPEPPKEGKMTIEARLIEEMKQGKSLHEAQTALLDAGEKKNAVKKAAILLKKLFSSD